MFLKKIKNIDDNWEFVLKKIFAGKFYELEEFENLDLIVNFVNNFGGALVLKKIILEGGE